MKHFLFIIFAVSFLCDSPLSFGDEPDTLRIFDASTVPLGELIAPWKHILPKKQKAYTNFSVVRSAEGPYLRAISSNTSSWLEIDVDNIDIEHYSTMEWMWKVDRFPESEWEMNPAEDDFAIRIELVYDFKGGAKNILNIIRKGLFTSILKKYPPELIVSYVWSLNVPFDKQYVSPENKRMIIIPIESDTALKGRWIREKRRLRENHDTFKGTTNPLFLKKIRIRSDTEDLPSIAESGLKYIYLIAE